MNTCSPKGELSLEKGEINETSTYYMQLPSIKEQKMLVSLIMLALGLGTEPAGVPSPLPVPSPGQEWRMVWNDEFDGAALDENKWERIGDSPRRRG